MYTFIYLSIYIYIYCKAVLYIHIYTYTYIYTCMYIWQVLICYLAQISQDLPDHDWPGYSVNRVDVNFLFV